MQINRGVCHTGRMFGRILKNRRLWEAPLLDMWTIPHLLSGFFIAWAILRLTIDPWLGLGLSILIAVFWELFEKITHLSDDEHHTNGPSDVVAAQIGYGAGIWTFFAYAGTGTDTILLVLAAAVFIVICILGWLSHHWYGR